MNKNTKIILLSIISVLIIITIVLGITYSFMRPINETSSITSVNLESCANITLTDTGESINLSNSYPMTKNRAFETTPYTFTVSSSCTDGSGFNLYLATLNTNTLSDSSIHYIITEHGNKNVITEGILSEATNGVSDFQDYELDELNNGINGTYGSIYRLYTGGIQQDTEVSYDLYLYIDESVTNETMGQTFSAGLAVKASDYDFATVDEVTVTDATNDSITVSVSASGGTNAIGTYYYSINNGSYTSSNTNTYTFSGLSAGTNYSIRVYVKDTNGIDSNVYTINAETESVTYICNTGTNLATCIKNQYTSQGANGIYYHTSSLANSAADNSYRYAGANPNNYVCFGSDAASCPDANLYRIIGVFGNQVKLIMADYPTTSQTGTSGAYYTTYANTSWSTSYYKGDQSLSSVGTYYWNPSGTNTWSSSSLTTTNLNSTFLNSISSTYRNQIADATWYVNGYSTNSATPATWHDNESTGTTWTGKIGLMYVSDYGFAASNSAWTTNVGSYNSSSITSNNWMYMGLTECTISRRSSNTYSAYVVNSSGNGGNYSVSSGSGASAVRPSFYLTSSVSYASGSGTATDPIRIS